MLRKHISLMKKKTSSTILVIYGAQIKMQQHFGSNMGLKHTMKALTIIAEIKMP